MMKYRCGGKELIPQCWGSRDRKNAWAPWPAFYPIWWTSGQQNTLSQKKIWEIWVVSEGMTPTSILWPPHTCTSLIICTCACTHPHTNTCTQIHKINRYIISFQSNVTSSWQIMSRQKGLIIHFHFMSMCSPLQRSFSLSHTWVLIFLSYIALTTSFSLSSHKYPIKILMECGYIL